ncbi:hypothetical protein IL306_005747 [Fusarium sp. DS 682]|nr:hypothetical protein IL306_005747 [Fusarium sp. DS 682]
MERQKAIDDEKDRLTQSQKAHNITKDQDPLQAKNKSQRQIFNDLKDMLEREGGSEDTIAQVNEQFERIVELEQECNRYKDQTIDYENRISKLDVEVIELKKKLRREKKKNKEASST